MEKWKKLPYEGKKGEHYEISSMGNMRKWHPGEKNPQLLKGSKIGGYQVFNTKLTNGRGTSLYVHKIVAEHFVKRSKEEKSFVIHRDYNKANNIAKNLKWVNRKEMEKHHSVKPTKEDIKQNIGARVLANISTKSANRGKP